MRKDSRDNYLPFRITDRILRCMAGKANNIDRTRDKIRYIFAVVGLGIAVIIGLTIAVCVMRTMPGLPVIIGGFLFVTGIASWLRRKVG